MSDFADKTHFRGKRLKKGQQSSNDPLGQSHNYKTVANNIYFQAKRNVWFCKILKSINMDGLMYAQHEQK